MRNFGLDRRDYSDVAPTVGGVMGVLTCAQQTVHFEDHLLTHLQIVIVNRFRRGEAFLLSWIDAVEVGSGRSSIWLAPTMPVRFNFASSRVPPIDRQWVADLDEAAASPAGLVVRGPDGQFLRIGAGRPSFTVRTRGTRAGSTVSTPARTSLLR